MASANSANNSNHINIQNESTLLDINEIRSERLVRSENDERLVRSENELKIALFLGGYSDNPDQIANIEIFLDKNQDTILIIFDGALKGFKMMEAFQEVYKERIFFIYGDFYKNDVWQLFLKFQIEFDKIIVDFSVINNFDKMHTTENIKLLFYYLYELLKNNGLLFMYTNYDSLTDNQKKFLFEIKYKYHNFKIHDLIEFNDYRAQYPIINVNNHGKPITLCLTKIIPKRELNGGSIQKNKLKTKTKRKSKSKSGSRTKRKSKSKSK